MQLRRHKGIKMAKREKVTVKCLSCERNTFGTQKCSACVAVLIEQAVKRAKQEVIDDRDRIHKINLECARQGAKQEVFDDIDKEMGFLTCKIIGSQSVLLRKKFTQLKDKHLNTNNTEKKDKQK